MTMTTPRRPRWSTLQRMLIAGCALLIVGIQVILIQSYHRLNEESQVFENGGAEVTTIANAQRELLRLQNEYERFTTTGDTADLRLQRAIAARQVDLVTRRGYPEGSESRAQVEQIMIDLAHFDETLDAWPAETPSDMRQHLRGHLGDAELAIKRLYDIEEVAFLRQASRAVLNAREAQTWLMALSPLTVALGGATILMIRRRSRRDVSDAYEALKLEMDLRRGAQDALADSERRYRTLLHSGADLTLVVDADGAMRHVTPASQRLLGRPPAELQGSPLAELVDPASLHTFEETARALAPHHGASCIVDLQVSHADGTSLVLETTVTDLRHDPDVGGMVLHARDVTERRSLELQLRHAQKLESVGRLAAGVAHELNTPIQFIGDNLQFMARAFEEVLAASQPPTPELDEELDFLRAEIPQALAQSLDGIDSVARIVRAMKVFGHPAGEEKVPVVVGDAIRTTAVVANNELKYLADVELEIDDDLPPVMAHPGDLNQVLLNLLVNAAHAIGEVAEARGRGLVTVRARRQDDHIVVEVTDTGTGIDPADADRVFDPFFTTKDVGQGTGQGLALSRSLIVDRHAGTLDFTSEVGVGTTFRITLPLSVPDHAEPTQEAYA